MPSRFSLTTDPDTVQAHFGYANHHAFPPREAIAAAEPVMIVRRGPGGDVQSHLVRWGLIPSWVRDFDRLGTILTARTETILEKISFRGGIRHKRCLVPANAFYVWSGAKGRRRPHVVALADNMLMGFAAIYEQWMGADGSEIDSVAILTVPSKPPLSAFTARAPAVVEAQNFASWLDCRGVRAQAALARLSGQHAPEFHIDPAED